MPEEAMEDFLTHKKEVENKFVGGDIFNIIRSLPTERTKDEMDHVVSYM
jgi:CRP-like cAMP-binding protein